MNTTTNEIDNAKALLETTTRWTCRGDVRGDCGVIHRSAETAQAHVESDHAACALPPTRGYSDRVVVDAGSGEQAQVCGKSCSHDECYS